MPGSDVAVVGMVGTDCFAIDYFLQSRVQCDYASGQVLPQSPNCNRSRWRLQGSAQCLSMGVQLRTT